MNNSTFKRNILVFSFTTIFGLCLTFSGYSQIGQNLAYLAKFDHSTGGVTSTGYGPENYNDSIICAGATCFGWITTISNPDPNAWIEINWGNSYQKFDQITIYVNDNTSRALSGATIQTWNGTAFVNHYTYNITTLSTLSYTINFPVLISNRIRLTNISYIGNPNPATEEIEIRYSKFLAIDAGMSAFNAPAKHITPGSNNVLATIMNMGKDTLRTAGMRWAVDGTLQTSPSNWTGKLAQLKNDPNKLMGSYNFTSGIRNLKAWTVNPNGVLDSNAYNDTVRTSIYVCNPVSGTYVVDWAGTGDFKTFNEALAWVNSCGMGGPVKIRVKPGSYTEQLTITNIPGISKTNTLTFESFNLDSTSVNLNYTSTSTYQNWVVMMSGVSHITFRNITIEATGASYGTVVNLADISDSNTFMNNILKTTTQSSTDFSVIIFGSLINGNTQDEYNVIRNNFIIGGFYGIRIYGPPGTFARGNVIDHNIFKDFYYYGLFLVYQDSLKVTNNIVENSSISGTAVGIMPYYSYSTEVSGNHVKLYGSSTLYGIYNNYANDLDTSALSTISNNFVSLGTSTGTATSYGFYNYYSGYINIYNNTVNIYNSSTTSYGMYFYNGVTGSYNLKNNIIVNNTGGYSLYFNTTGLLKSSNYNNLYTNGTNLVYLTSNYTNLAAWKTASSMDNNSISASVKFYSLKDLHVNTTVVNNLGNPITGITKDFDGESRSATPDIGADEFTLIYNDAGVSDINSPLSPCPGSNTVSVKIKNYGIKPLSSVKVNWQVNGTTQTQATVSFTLPLAQYRDTIVTLGSYSFTSNTIYKLKFWTTLPNSISDSNTRNDNFNYSISNTAMNGTYIIGATTSDYKTFTEAVSDLTKRGVCSSVLFRVKAGSYNENIKIPAIIGSSASNTITFESYNLDSNSVDLNYAAINANTNFVIGLYGADYITFRKLKIRATGASLGRAIFLTGNSDYCTFSNNIISSLPTATNGNFAGVYSDATLDNYTTLKNNKISGGYYGIYLSGQSTTAKELNAVITGNSITNFYYYGIYTYYTISPIISSNIIESSPNAANAYGIYCYYNYDTLKVTKNKVNLTGGSTNYGINMYYSQCSATLPGLVANNFVTINGISTTTNYGLYSYYNNYLNIYNNSILSNTKSGTSSYAFYCANGSGNNVVNNIFSNQGGGYAYYLNSTAAISTSNYNNLYTTGTILGYWNGNRADLTAWKSATGTNETNSRGVNPYFYSNTDLHIYSPQLNSAATVLSLVKDDIDNEPRTSTPDIGADEFTPTGIDASIVELVSPKSACPGTVNNVSIRLTNYGLNTITSTKIKWSINGVKKATYIYPGNLASTKDTVIVLGSETFNKNVNYLIKIWTDTVNGLPSQNKINDTLIILNYRAALSGNYTIGSGKDYPNFASVVSDLNNYGICGPVVIQADAGTYNEHVSISPVSGASAINTITFRSATGDSSTVIMSYNAANTTDNYVVQLLGADYIRFEKMTLLATSTSGYGCVVELRNAANYNIFRNNILSYTGPASGSAYGVYSSNSYTPCSYNLIDNNSIPNPYYGIYWYGNSTSVPCKKNIIRNNLIPNFYWYGMYLYYQDSIEIFKNKINGGIYAPYGLNCYYLSNCNISSNQVYMSVTNGNPMYGIMLQYCTGTSNASLMLTNNMVSLSGTSTNTLYGIYSYYCYYNKYYHNSVHISCGSSTGSSCIYFTSPSTGTTYGNIEVQNNILVNTGGGYSMYVDANAKTLGYLLRSDYNDLFVTGSNIGHYGTTDNPLLSNWRANLPLRPDPRSLNVMPSFVSLFDLHLSNYSGMFVSLLNPLNVTKDIDDETRSLLKPVLGADENPHLPIDAGIKGIKSPQKLVCEGIYPVSANIYNFGLNKIDSVYIDYFINDVLQRTIKFKGTLTYLSYFTVSFGNDTFTASSSPIRIKIKTRLPNGSNADTYTFNDADSIDVKIILLPVISSIKNDTICQGDSATLQVFSNNSNIFTWYDSITSGNILSVDSIFNTPILSKTTTYYVDASTGGNPANITTSNSVLAPTNMGNMFDIKATNTDVVIDSFAVHLTSSSLGQLVPFEIYYRVGSYVGNEANATSWILLGSDTVISNGQSVFTDISAGSIKIKKNQIFGFYITTTDYHYLLNNTAGAKSFSDAYIQLTTGTNTFYPFDPTFTPASTWNGTVYYGTGSLCRSVRTPVVAKVYDVPNIKLGNDTAFCKGGNITLDAGNGTNYTYNWKYGISNTTISTNQTIKVDSAGTYRVIVSNLCGNTSTDTINISVGPLPDAVFTINTNNQCLNGNSFVFTNHSTIASGKFGSFLWKFGDGQTITDSNTSHSYSTTGTYTVKLLTLSDFGCSDSVSANVVVNPNPLVDLVIDNDKQCLNGNLFNFTNNSTVPGGTISSQKWYFGDAGISTFKLTSHKYLTDGSFDVKLVTFSNKGCSDSLTKTVTLYPQPASGFSINDSSQCFKGNKFDFTNSSTIKSGTLSYNWNLGDATLLTSTDASHTYSTIGNFKVKLKAKSDFGCNDSVTKMVYIKPHPVVNLGKDTTIKGNMSLTLLAGSSIDSAEWSNGAKTNSIVVDSAHFGGLGLKYIQVAVYKNGCAGYDTISVTIKTSVGIDIVEGNFRISVYPNPVNDLLQIKVIGNSAKSDIILTDMLGNQIWSGIIQNTNGVSNGQIDMSKFSRGAYLLKVISDGNIKVIKVIKN